MGVSSGHYFPHGFYHRASQLASFPLALPSSNLFCVFSVRRILSNKTRQTLPWNSHALTMSWFHIALKISSCLSLPNLTLRGLLNNSCSLLCLPIISNSFLCGKFSYSFTLPDFILLRREECRITETSKIWGLYSYGETKNKWKCNIYYNYKQIILNTRV